ncbi:hypothetical protein [Rothia sp. 11254D007CT]
MKLARLFKTNTLAQNQSRKEITPKDRHHYKAQIVFMMDVEVAPDELNTKIWSDGPDPHPNKPDYHVKYGADWRSAYFPSTLAPVMYGKSLPTGCEQTAVTPRLHSTRINHDAHSWFKNLLIASRNLTKDPKIVDSFTFIRAELQLYDRGTSEDITFGQFVLYTEVETRSIGKIQEVFRVLTREENRTSKTRSLVPGSHLYDYLDSEHFKKKLGGLGFTDGIHFYDNASYLRDTEAKIYSAVHLRIDSTDCDEIIQHINKGNLITSTPSWQAILGLMAANVKLHKLINEKGLLDYYKARIRTIFEGRYSLITRLGAAFITLNDSRAYTKNSELYFLAEHIDALIIGRLHDQILRNAEVKLVSEMSKTPHGKRDFNNFEHISEGVLKVHHQFIADSIRYWMDDVTANSGMGMVTLSKYKEAIGYQNRFDQMRVKLEDIAVLAQQDVQEAEANRQERLSQSQEKFATILAIIGFIAIPLPLLNDGLAFVKEMRGGENPFWSQAWNFVWIGVIAFLGLLILTILIYQFLKKTRLLEKLGISPYNPSQKKLRC